LRYNAAEARAARRRMTLNSRLAPYHRVGIDGAAFVSPNDHASGWRHRTPTAWSIAAVTRRTRWFLSVGRLGVVTITLENPATSDQPGKKSYHHHPKCKGECEGEHADWK
jgi:hypothetical protein